MSVKKIFESLRKINEATINLHKSIIPTNKEELQSILDNEGFTYEWIGNQFVININGSSELARVNELSDKYDVRHNAKNEDSSIDKYFKEHEAELISGKIRAVPDLNNSNRYIFGFKGNPLQTLEDNVSPDELADYYYDDIPSSSDKFWRIEMYNDNMECYYQEFDTFKDMIDDNMSIFVYDEFL